MPIPGTPDKSGNYSLHSGSVELKEKIHESLAGRKRVFELNTLSFDEFVNFKTWYRYEDSLSDFFQVEEEKTMKIKYSKAACPLFTSTS